MPSEELEHLVGEALSQGEVSQREISYTHPDGGERWIVFSATPLQDQTETRVLLVANDITDRRQHQEWLEETARLVSVGELAAGAAYELNNPLAGVLGFAQVLMVT